MKMEHANKLNENRIVIAKHFSKHHFNVEINATTAAVLQLAITSESNN